MLNNIPSPYSVDLFACLENSYPEYEFHFIFTNTNEDNRNWNLKEGKLRNVTFLKSSVLKLKTAYDHRYIHFPADPTPHPLCLRRHGFGQAEQERFYGTIQQKRQPQRAGKGRH